MKTRFALLTLILTINFAFAQQNVYYDVTAGNGNGLRLWSLDAYKIHMGYGTEYLYGPVTDYSIKSNMGGGNGRGWTWGGSGATPVAALNTLGTMQIAGTFTSQGLFSNVIPNTAGLTVTGNTSANTISEIYLQRANSSTGVGNAPAIQFDDQGSNSHNIIQGSSGGLQFFSNYAGAGWTEKMRLASNGFFGVGTNTPGSQLHLASSNVNGTALRFESTSANGRIYGIGSNFITGNGEFGIYDYTASAERFRISNSGKVGIGTASPDNLLTLNGAIGFFRTGTSPTITSAGYINYINSFNIGTASSNDPLNLQTNSQTRLTILNNGYVGIGSLNPDALLSVKGQVHANEVKVDLNVPGPDYVFEKDYALTSLDSIKTYIDQNKHLPEIPSAKEMEKNGIQLGEMNMLLLKKIEELTLYMIEMKKEMEAQRLELERLKKK